MPAHRFACCRVERNALWDGDTAGPAEDLEHLGSRGKTRCRVERETLENDVVDLAWLVEDGEYIDPEDLEASTLYEDISGDDEPMPPSPNDRLTQAEIASIGNWIEAGAEIDE